MANGMNGKAFAAFVRQKVAENGWTSLGKVDGVTLGYWFDLFQETLPAVDLLGIPASKEATGASAKSNLADQPPAPFQELGGRHDAPKPFKLTGETIKKERKRDLCFEALAGVCRISVSELTPSARGQLNRALDEIRKASPDVTQEEIRRRALAYAAEYPQLAKIVPSTLARCWPRYSPKNATITQIGATAWVEPTEWRQELKTRFPDDSWAVSARAIGWERCPEPWKARIVRECQQQDRAAQG